MVIDLSAPQIYNEVVMKKVNNFGLPFIKLDVTITGMVNAFDRYMVERNATDAALIMAKDSGMLYVNPNLRTV